MEEAEHSNSTPRRRNMLHRAVQVLNVMVGDDRWLWGVGELARECGWPVSTTSRVLQSLVDEGLVKYDPAGRRYGLGLDFVRFGRRAAEAFPLQHIALPILRELVSKCNETALLYVYDQHRLQTMPVLKVDSQHGVRRVLDVGTWNDLHCFSGGLAIMAFLPEDDVRQIILQTGLRPTTTATISSAPELHEALATIRTKGYAVSKGQRIPGSVGLAAPIRCRGVQVIGSVSLSIPEQRYDDSLEPELAGWLMDCAARLCSQEQAAKPTDRESAVERSSIGARGGGSRHEALRS